MSERLDRLIAVARDDLGTAEARSLDWETLEERLFSRLEAEESDERVDAVRLGRPALLLSFAVAAGLVGALALGPRPGDRSALDLTNGVRALHEGAGAIVRVSGSGTAVRNGASSGPGDTLRQGDVLEARGGAVTIERPGKLTIVLEPGTRVRVTDARTTVIFALETGAVEARVVPVASGEAFAVDVRGTRVAVHGTALRVALEPGRVVVDLSEGVVAVGDAPLSGALIGTALVAPAHAEFDPASRAPTLAVTHDPAQVRSLRSIELSAPQPALVAPTLVPRRPEPKTPRPPAAGGALRVDPALRVNPRTPAAQFPSAPPPSSATAGPAASAAPRDDEARVADAVSACLAEHTHAENVTVLVSTTLTLTLSEEGAVKSALFDPPVAPDVNECAAAWIYRARFSHGGTIAVPVTVKN